MPADPHADLNASLASFNRKHVHRTMQYRLVHYGFWSSIALLILMFLNVFVPNLFIGWYVAIAIMYIIFQLLEVSARDPLNTAEVLEAHLFALTPALIGLLLRAIDLVTGKLYTPIGRTTMDLWLVVAWVCFIFSVAIAMRMLATPYRRDESHSPPT